jgi:hypothetical protein
MTTLIEQGDLFNPGFVQGPFKLQNVNPHFPSCGVGLLDVRPHSDQQGRMESWDDVQHRYEGYAHSEFGYGTKFPYRSISQEVKLIVGTLALPQSLVFGTYKKLFVEFSETPSTWEVHAVAHALFNPDRAFWGERWSDVCDRANFLAMKRNRIATQVKELLALGA